MQRLIDAATIAVLSCSLVWLIWAVAGLAVLTGALPEWVGDVLPGESP